MEAEVRAILRETLAEADGGLGTRIHARFAALGGVGLQAPARNDMPRRPLHE
jgi:antitoxin FitA